MSQCEATCSSHGQQCSRQGQRREGGDTLCGTHAHWVEADGDGEHVAQCNELLVSAMRHPDWSATSAEIRHLIEHAWVCLARATGEDSL